MNSTHEKQDIAAFFDFDETLLSIDSAGVGFKVLKEEGYLTKGFMLKMGLVLFLFKLGLFNDERVARSMLSFYKGHKLQPFIDSAEDFYQDHLKPNLSVPAVNRLKWHQEQGHHTVLLTGSIAYYLKPVMRELEIDHLLCTYLEVSEEGVLTGRSRGPVCVGDTKVEQAMALADKLGVDLSKSYAYGNSHLDIPILEQVGHPVMVTPSKALHKHGESLQWETL
ncbi:MAG: HAD-IB family hydrolase [Candidatus Marinimicrobia bacterium]|nr:HAD-IB family hydrolase [Candidatus Neomarinimicrobiota bacterium]MCF7904608.1 HAD-IB family hydrolase [Candidatus Neomarinimicrobiota bacterium]